jgi:hypothetical protein
MMAGKDLPARRAEHLKQVGPYLKQADKLVKEKKYAAALEEIRQARLIDPKNLYALAYEDRVRALIAQPDPEIVQQASPILEHVVNLAIVEAQRTAEVVAKQEEQREIRKKDEVERLRAEEGRRSAIEEKVSGLIARAEEFCEKGEFHRALDEVARAYLLDPSNERITKLEERIRDSQDEAFRLEEEERLQKEKERENRKQELIQARVGQLRREREEKQKRELKARQEAEQAKIKQYLSRSEELMNKGELDAALSELVFAIVISPLDERILALERQIKEKQEKEELEKNEEYKRRQEERQKKLKELENLIVKQIAIADDLAHKNRFGEALRVITRAMALDPMSEDLLACEQRVISMRDEADRSAEDERRRQEESMRKMQEDELKRLEESERKKALVDEETESQFLQVQKKQQITPHLDKARESMQAKHYEDALAEIALAFIILSMKM